MNLEDLQKMRETINEIMNNFERLKGVLEDEKEKIKRTLIENQKVREEIEHLIETRTICINPEKKNEC